MDHIFTTVDLWEAKDIQRVTDTIYTLGKTVSGFVLPHAGSGLEWGREWGAFPSRLEQNLGHRDSITQQPRPIFVSLISSKWLCYVMLFCVVFSSGVLSGGRAPPCPYKGVRGKGGFDSREGSFIHTLP